MNNRGDQGRIDEVRRVANVPDGMIGDDIIRRLLAKHGDNVRGAARNLRAILFGNLGPAKVTGDE